jgi:hypothetical protein
MIFLNLLKFKIFSVSVGDQKATQIPDITGAFWQKSCIPCVRGKLSPAFLQELKRN